MVGLLLINDLINRTSRRRKVSKIVAFLYIVTFDILAQCAFSVFNILIPFQYVWAVCSQKAQVTHTNVLRVEVEIRPGQVHIKMIRNGSLKILNRLTSVHFSNIYVGLSPYL